MHSWRRWRAQRRCIPAGVVPAEEEEEDGRREQAESHGPGAPGRRARPPGPAGAVKIGHILFVGGHTPGPAYRGKLGTGFTVEQGYDGARQACLHC